jgi:two-component system response regulator LytT
MKIVIIEDEWLTADDLMQTIREADPSLEIIAIIKSVDEGVLWFRSNPAPDLIFSDIQLGDGLSFEILAGQNVPVIFCTAYDEYALNAFNANGIDYILKPFTRESVSRALEKYKNLTRGKVDDISRQYESVRRLLFDVKTTRPSSLLIHFKDTIFPLKIAEVALFRLEHGIVHLTTFEKKIYYPGKSLDELEEIVGDDFFRVNRQYLINRGAIVNASSILSRKLSISVNVPVSETVTISKEKTPSFLRWLTGGV